MNETWFDKLVGNAGQIIYDVIMGFGNFIFDLFTL